MLNKCTRHLKTTVHLKNAFEDSLHQMRDWHRAEKFPWASKDFPIVDIIVGSPYGSVEHPKTAARTRAVHAQRESLSALSAAYRRVIMVSWKHLKEEREAILHHG